MTTTPNPAPVTTTAEDAQEVAAVRAPVAVATSDAERAAFEMWAKKRGNRLEKFGSALGIWAYEDNETQAAFVAWQARAALPIDFKQATDQGGWISADNRLPECDHEAIFIGINSAGFAGAFNALVERGGTTYCLYGTPEEEHSVMSCLQWWQPMPAAPTLQGVADGDAESVEPELCPRCDGSGTETVMSDGGPDAYDVEIDCAHCRGNQTLAAAYVGVKELLEREEKKYREASAILYLGRANPTAAKRIAEIAEYLKKPGAQLDWAHDRLMALADMAKTSGDAVGGKSGGAA